MTENDVESPDAGALVEEEIPIVDDIHELLTRVTLVGFVTYELRGRRRDGGFEDLRLTGDSETANGGWRMRVLVQQTPTQLAIRAVGESDAPEVEINADMAAIYDKDEPFRVTDELVQEFTDRVGLMTLYPYLRQSVHDVSSRLGTSVTLDLLKPGDLVPEPHPDLEEV